ncbi:MAG: potassium transporter TrkH [Lachnospiraceae bacterium]|nr:potassium transporter TrkH [Lachnospiraceae bacterium]
MKRNGLLRFRISSVQLIPLSFLLTILAGAVLLMLPFSSAPGEKTDFLSALFTSTSAVCVTGLVVADTFSHWSLFGQFVLLILMQVGGLGVVAVGSMFLLIGRKKFYLGDRKLLGESLNIEKSKGLLRVLTRIFKGVALVEGVGVLLFAIKFVPQFGAGKGLWTSLFQSVSAFCNCGMDVIGPVSLGEYTTSRLVLITTMVLIALGGIGFVVWFDVVDGIRETFRTRLGISGLFGHLSVHSKLVLTMTAGLIVTGAAVILAAEYNNPGTLGAMGTGEKILNAFFQSVTSRTAGFASFPQDQLTGTSCMAEYALMFIGGSPVGTAGGIKTVTAFLFFMNAMSYIRGKKENVVFNRSVSYELMRKSGAIVFISTVTVFVMTFLLMATGGIVLTDALFEVISALGTVGLSRNLTPHLNVIGRIIIITSMYLGRIGPISMAVFFVKNTAAENAVRHAEGKFYVG